MSIFLQVALASRTKETEVGQPLYLSKSVDLANHYLGFNGWTSSIKRLEEDKVEGADHSAAVSQIRFFCQVELSFPRQGVSTQGIGAWEEAYSPQGKMSSKSRRM
jgi:RAD52 motif-containing protein 1